jgi:hypothetical protein
VRNAVRFTIVAALALVSACGNPLGTYQVRDVKLVPGDALTKIEPYIDPDPQMLRIKFVSKTNLYDASDGGGSGLYVFASFCPYDEGRVIYVSEPYYNDRSRYGPTRIVERKVLPDGRIIEKVDSEDRQPIKDTRTGDYVYTTYFRLNGQAKEDMDLIAYDLRRQAGDLCLRIKHPGYFITPSRSRVFAVPAQMIQRALLNQAPA